MADSFDINQLIQISYLVVAVLFILGLKAMSSPVTARRGILQAGLGMLIAVVASFASKGMGNYMYIIAAMLVGGSVAALAGKKLPMTAMPQGVAVFNGLGGGSAAAIASLELYKLVQGIAHTMDVSTILFSVLAVLIGSLALSGSIVAFLKLQGILKGTFRLPGQNGLLIIILLLTLVAGIVTGFFYNNIPFTFSPVVFLVLFLALGLLVGALGTLPIGGADMPVVISLLNAMTGLAVGLEGYAVKNAALIVAGIVVGASGLLLTKLMAKAMNRKLGGVLFKKYTVSSSSQNEATANMKEASAIDTASILRYASSVIIVPGYGMAVAGAQHKYGK